GLGLGTKMVDYVIGICEEMGVETLYAIMLSDNYRALDLMRKMGFKLQYTEDGTVKGTLNLKEEVSTQCLVVDKVLVKVTNSRESSEQEKQGEAEGA
ncbi:MAG: GNAT family N-acetyltransferase, partial [Candidatus Bathyarchaeia archaeon]